MVSHSHPGGLYSVCEFLKRHEDSQIGNGLAPAAVITGQPGIGEFQLSIQQAEHL